MLEITILASGSSGNAALVRSKKTAILIDAGLSAKQLRERLSLCNVAPEEIDGILITHEHGDHVKGLPQWCKQYNTPLYCNRHTATILRSKILQQEHWKIFETGSSFVLGTFSLDSFAIPHDAVDPVGFVVREKTSSFGFLTDLGYPTRLVLESLRSVQGLLLEANYDEELLEQDTKRPWAVKQRISSRHGHLSNDAAAEVLQHLLHEQLSHVVLGHLSADCNKEELALTAINRIIHDQKIDRWCAGPDRISPTITL
ncbi:MAG: MBL fold metallo-hydrolase [Chthoniobacterales bacterium]|nr:MBL fold metallo-hydrolase [Chthoniobacterales bacterium]